MSSGLIINQPRASYYIGGAEMISFEHAKNYCNDQRLIFITINPLTIGKCYSAQYLSFKEKYRHLMDFVELDIGEEFRFIYEIKEGVDRCRWNWESLVYNKTLNLMLDDILKGSKFSMMSYYILDAAYIFSSGIENNCLYLCGTPKVRDDFQGSFLLSYNRVIAISEEVASYWGRYFRGEIKVVPSGVDANRFNPRCRSRDNEKRVVVLFIGRLLARKGVFVFAKAARELKTTYGEGVEFWVAGDGVEHGRLKNEYGDYIRFFGPVNDPEIVMSSADVIVSTSLYGEGLKGVILEAMACGSVVVAEGSSVNKALLGCGRGVIVERVSVDILSKTLRDLVSRRNELSSIGEGARRYVQLHHDWGVISKRLKEYIL